MRSAAKRYIVERTIGGRLWRQMLLGPSYWWHRWLIGRSKRWDCEIQQRYIEPKIRKRMKRHGRNEVRSKDHYREQQARYNRFCVKGLTKVMRTGGTSGSPLVFYMDTFARRQKERAYLFDIWASIGYRPFDLRVVFRGNAGRTLLTYEWIENCYVLSPSQFSSANRCQVTKFIKGLPPFFLHVYPSSLFTFIDVVGETSFSELPIRGVLAGSEVFPVAQMQAFERKFGFKVAHWYGHSEYATLARYCPTCHGFHFYPTYGHTELVPVEREHWRIVATSFNCVGTQFVRYDTGDLATPSTRGCPEPFLRVDSIVGREQEVFIDREGHRRAFGPYLFGIHNEFWDYIFAVQFAQRQAGSLHVKIVEKVHSNRAWIESYLRERFAICDLSFEYVNAIGKTVAGKHRYYIPLEAS